MANPKRNLLEAFNQANDSEKLHPSAASPATAGEKAAASGEGELPELEPITPPRVPRGNGNLWIGAIVACWLCFGAGVAVGRWSAPQETRAAEPEGGESVEPRESLERLIEDSSQPSEPGPARVTSVDRALREAENRYTIVAVTYGASALDQDLAWSTYDHFEVAGLPVATPFARGERTFLLVGAAASTADLRSLLSSVRDLSGPGGKRGEFRDAYIEEIDDLGVRSN